MGINKNKQTNKQTKKPHQFWVLDTFNAWTREKNPVYDPYNQLDYLMASNLEAELLLLRLYTWGETVQYDTCVFLSI